MYAAALIAVLSVHALADAGDAQRMAREVLTRGDYQRELPAPAPAQADASQTRSAPTAPSGADDGSGSVSTPIRQVAFALMVVGAFAVLAMVLVWLWRELSGYAGPVAEVADGPDEPAPPVFSAPPDDAEALARERRYGDAVHALLAHALVHVARTTRSLPPSLTSREILTQVRLSADAQGALAALVSAVEVSWFGGDEPSERDFQACLGHYRRLQSGMST